MKKQQVASMNLCPNCKYASANTKPKRKVNWFIFIALFLCTIVGAPIYWYFCKNSGQTICPKCGAEMIVTIPDVKMGL